MNRRYAPARLAVTLGAALVVLAATGACTSDRSAQERAADTSAASTAHSTSDGPADRSASAPTDEFPVEITHMLGTIRIERAPQRIVALGMADADVAVALGVTPLTAIEDPDRPGHAYPWLDERIDPDRTDLLPQVDTGQISLEAILAYRPDLVLATTATGTVAGYDALTAAGVPVLVAEHGFLEDSWQDLTRSIGRALGRSAQAEELVAETEAEVDRLAEDLAGIAGRTFVVALDRGPDGFNLLNDPDNSSVRLLSRLGLRLPDRLLDATGGETGGATAGGLHVSDERVDLLDADVLFLTTAADVEARIGSDPIFESLDVVRRGDYLAWDPPVAAGLRIASPLSVAYVLDQIEPTLRRLLPTADAGSTTDHGEPTTGA